MKDLLYKLKIEKNKQLNKLLQLKSKEIQGLTQDDIVEYYSNIYDTLELYQNMENDEFSEEDFEILKQDLREVLEVYDNQASFFVLKNFKNISEINKYSPEVRKDKFLFYLKKDKINFIHFFNIRENVLKKMKAGNIISNMEYSKLTCRNAAS